MYKYNEKSATIIASKSYSTKRHFFITKKVKLNIYAN